MSRSDNQFFRRSGERAPGFDREILDGFARLQRVELTVVPVADWGELVPALLSGRGDVIAGRFGVTDDRRAAVAFTREVLPTRHIVVTRKPNREVGALAELRGQSWA